MGTDRKEGKVKGGRNGRDSGSRKSKTGRGRGRKESGGCSSTCLGRRRGSTLQLKGTESAGVKKTDTDRTPDLICAGPKFVSLYNRVTEAADILANTRLEGV